MDPSRLNTSSSFKTVSHCTLLTLHHPWSPLLLRYQLGKQECNYFFSNLVPKKFSGGWVPVCQHPFKKYDAQNETQYSRVGKWMHCIQHTSQIGYHTSLSVSGSAITEEGEVQDCRGVKTESWVVFQYHSVWNTPCIRKTTDVTCCLSYKTLPTWE